MCFVYNKLHAFKYHYILLFYNKKNGQIVKILMMRYYFTFFWSGKLLPGLVKIVSLPDRMSCKVLRTFVKTAISNILLWLIGHKGKKLGHKVKS